MIWVIIKSHYIVPEASEKHAYLDGPAGNKIVETN
jgi:hypothetical protein